MVRVPLGDLSYDIVLGDGVLSDLPQLVQRSCPATHYAVITDSTVAPLYGERIAAALAAVAPSTLVTFPAGEWNKTRETWTDLTDRLLAAEIGRDGAIVAVGGGVTGDLGGFVAATYLRGVPHVQVPTTLLAMIDSSIGGKTAVDTPAGKNLVGAFHQPRMVIADIATLDTLPPIHLAAGMAEAIKHGAIEDAAYFTRVGELPAAVFAHDRAALQEIVGRSIALKAGIVAADERERGRRAVLNFGHTVGHALEAVTGYELLHGEAVAIGMAAEAQLGTALGVTAAGVADEIARALEAYRLPTALPAGLNRERFLEAMRRDKKVRDVTVRFALPSTLGKPYRSENEWTLAVSGSDLIEKLGLLS